MRGVNEWYVVCLRHCDSSSCYACVLRCTNGYVKEYLMKWLVDLLAQYECCMLLGDTSKAMHVADKIKSIVHDYTTDEWVHVLSSINESIVVDVEHHVIYTMNGLSLNY